MEIRDALRSRRSIKKFTDRAVTREQIEELLELAVTVPNHRMTEPWRFRVLGPEARRKFGEALGARKAKKVEDAQAAALVREKVASEHAALPAMIAVAMNEHEDPEVRAEDYAATMMAVLALSLAAPALGLGAHIKTGAVMQDPAVRAALGVPAGERIIATIHLGAPAEVPAAKPRTSAAAKTVWVP